MQVQVHNIDCVRHKRERKRQNEIHLPLRNRHRKSERQKKLSKCLGRFTWENLFGVFNLKGSLFSEECFYFWFLKELKRKQGSANGRENE